MLASDLVSHLIPNQVNGFKYDRRRNQWVKDEVEEPQLPAAEPEEGDDPFRDIPDLSVDELQEMMRDMVSALLQRARPVAKRKPTPAVLWPHAGPPRRLMFDRIRGMADLLSTEARFAPD